MLLQSSYFSFIWDLYYARFTVTIKQIFWDVHKIVVFLYNLTILINFKDDYKDNLMLFYACAFYCYEIDGRIILHALNRFIIIRKRRTLMIEMFFDDAIKSGCFGEIALERQGTNVIARVWNFKLPKRVCTTMKRHELNVYGFLKQFCEQKVKSEGRMWLIIYLKIWHLFLLEEAKKSFHFAKKIMGSKFPN